MSVWAWILIALCALLVTLLVIGIWHYPRDNSF